MLLFGHSEILRILGVRWIGLAPVEGRHLQLATASLSVLGYDHDLTEPVIQGWNNQTHTTLDIAQLPHAMDAAVRASRTGA